MGCTGSRGAGVQSVDYHGHSWCRLRGQLAEARSPHPCPRGSQAGARCVPLTPGRRHVGESWLPHRGISAGSGPGDSALSRREWPGRHAPAHPSASTRSCSAAPRAPGPVTPSAQRLHPEVSSPAGAGGRGGHGGACPREGAAYRHLARHAPAEATSGRQRTREDRVQGAPASGFRAGSRARGVTCTPVTQPGHNPLERVCVPDLQQGRQLCCPSQSLTGPCPSLPSVAGSVCLCAVDWPSPSTGPHGDRGTRPESDPRPLQDCVRPRGRLTWLDVGCTALSHPPLCPTAVLTHWLVWAGHQLTCGGARGLEVEGTCSAPCIPCLPPRPGCGVRPTCSASGPLPWGQICYLWLRTDTWGKG